MRKPTDKEQTRASSHPQSSWWETMPGMLTGAAGIITAVAGLVVALHQIGFLGDQQLTQASAPAPSQAPTAVTSPQPSVPQAVQPSAPAERSAATVLSPERSESIAFPSGTEVDFRNHRGAGTYQVIAATIGRASSAKFKLKVTIRLTNRGPSDVGFWSDSFRLLADGVPRAPVSWLNDSVSARSAKDASVEFEAPYTARDFRLRLLVGDNDETADIPMLFSTVHK